MPSFSPSIGITCILLLAPAAAAEVSFAPPSILETPGATADILLVDLDGDGDRDLAALEVEFDFAVGEAHGMVNVALNDGAAGFPAVTTIPLGTFGSLEFALRTLVAADLDGDGDTDLAAIGTTAPLLLLFNDGAGAFGLFVNTGITVSFGQLTALLDAGDLDGDGAVDLALGLPGLVATNDGTGAFDASPFSDDSSPRNLEVVDLDGDGDEDIAYGFRVHRNDGKGAFTLGPGTYPGAGADECVFADFDGDGDQDVACARINQGQIAVAMNHGDGTFAAPVGIPAPTPFDLHRGRFDGDAHLDLLATTAAGNGTIRILLGGGDGTFAAPIALAAPNGPVAAAGDLDGDGLDDVVMSTTFQFTNGPLAILVNDGPDPGVPGDLDGDGSVGFADLSALLNAWGPCPAPPATCPADLNGDGGVGFADLSTLLMSWGGPG